MTTKHKPATPLPWENKEIGINEFPIGQFNTVCEIRGADRTGVADHILLTDSAYIAHAANAYPGLVQQARSLLLMMHGLKCPFDKPFAPKSDCLCNYHQHYQAGRDLLRELGEEGHA